MQPPRSALVQVGMSNCDDMQWRTAASVIPSPHSVRIVARLAVWVQGSHPVQAGSPELPRNDAQAAVKNC
jgi:hypothetical protein